MSYIFPLLAGVIHFYIFMMESFLWGKPRINKVFGMTPEQAETNRLFAFNQGFYNLFLCIAMFVGLFFSLGSQPEVGRGLMIYSCASMFMASVVLIYSNSKLKKAAIIQGVPPFVGLIGLLIL